MRRDRQTRSLGGGGTRYLTIPVDELDGLLDLLTVVRDELRDRGNVTRYVPQQTEEPAA